VVYLTKK